MNSSCVNVDENLVLSFFIIGCLLTMIGTLLNLCLCLLFWREKSLYKTPYGIFIIALSIADIVKLIAEYLVHILYFVNQSPYFVCSITWFLTMSSENLSYAFLCALGIERNLKVWITDRCRCLITRQRACIITLFILLFVIIHDHPFLFIPYDVSYCFLKVYNYSILFSCDNAYFKSYGYTFSLSDLILIENIGLNNLILPILIMSTNIILIFGLRRRANQRRNRLGKRKRDDWREQSVILYVLLASITFILLTSPIGILTAWSIVYNQKMTTNNAELVLDLIEIIHHCSHFPILLTTSSMIREKTFRMLCHSRTARQSTLTSRRSIDRCHCGSLSPIQLAEQTLINSLLNGYNKNIRPADQVSVAITATLRQLVGTDEKQQIMTSSSFISQRWFDNRLSWDPSNSSNITVVMLPVKNLWTPDTMVLNSADTSGYFTISDSSLASVRYDGEVYMILPALGIRTRCRFSLQQFPFDRQICSINLTSWAQGTNRITYTENSTLLIDISEYSENSLWKLTGTNVVVYHAGDRSPFEDTYTDVISIQLYLQRKPLFYLVNGIYACLITNCATLVAYAITFGPQIALCMSCFKIYSVYALNFSSVFPQQSEYVMKITLFFLLSITWTFISMVWFTVYNYLVTKGEMPEWLYDFCDHLQRMFSCSPPTKADGKTKKKKDINAENGKHQKSGDQQIVALHTQRHTGFQNIDNPVDVRPIEVVAESSVNRTIETGKPKCDFCNRCESCQADFDKNKVKNKSKKDIEAKCNALNNLAFSCVLLLMFSSNMVLWLSISQ